MGGSSSQSSENSSYLWPGQAKYLKDLYKNAQGLYEENPSYQDEAEQILEPLLNSATESFNTNLADYRGSDSILSGQNQGIQSLRGLQQEGVNPYLQDYFNAAADSVNKNLTRNILPSIRTSSNLAGQYGSSRQGIAEGLALSDANDQLSNLAATMYGQAYDADQGRRLQAAGADIQAMLGAQGQGATQASNTISGAGNLYNLGFDPYNKSWLPLHDYSSIIGNPIILSTGESEGSSWNIL